MKIREVMDRVRGRLGSLLGPGELSRALGDGYENGRPRAGNTRYYQAADHQAKRKRRRKMARESRRRNRRT